VQNPDLRFGSAEIPVSEVIARTHSLTALLAHDSCRHDDDSSSDKYRTQDRQQSLSHRGAEARLGNKAVVPMQHHTDCADSSGGDAKADPLSRGQANHSAPRTEPVCWREPASTDRVGDDEAQDKSA